MIQVTLFTAKSDAAQNHTSGPILRPAAGPIYIQATVKSPDEILGELELEVSADNVEYMSLEGSIKEVAAPGNFNWDGIATDQGGEGEISASANV
jgi:hypothetical protein